MRKGTLARIEIDVGMALVAAILVLAGYGLISALADRLDPKVRACVERTERLAVRNGKPMSRSDMIKFCKHLEAIGAL
ncbi:MAG TPA: hypothetical protein VMU08_08700 [Rhizomicrobium sp.]|nr:hypothetical protein [Rhizomicrobium sp.]